MTFTKVFVRSKLYRAWLDLLFTQNHPSQSK